MEIITIILIFYVWRCLVLRRNIIFVFMVHIKKTLLQAVNFIKFVKHGNKGIWKNIFDISWNAGSGAQVMQGRKGVPRQVGWGWGRAQRSRGTEWGGELSHWGLGANSINGRTGNKRSSQRERGRERGVKRKGGPGIGGAVHISPE